MRVWWGAGAGGVAVLHAPESQVRLPAPAARGSGVVQVAQVGARGLLRAAAEAYAFRCSEVTIGRKGRIHAIRNLSVDYLCW